MPSILTRQELPAPLRVVVTTDDTTDEKRAASPLTQAACSPTSDDERSAAIPTTAELEPLDDASPETIAFAIHILTTGDDWLQQHEAITVLRRAVVHHSSLLSDDAHIVPLVPALIIASDNLRSALSKNALLALGECCTVLRLARLHGFLVMGTSRPAVPLVDVLLRRATCEKRFLRDAALDTVNQLLIHLASPALIAAAAPYAASKNTKVVAVASRLMAHSLAQLHARNALDVEQFSSGVYEALVKFREGKDSAARSESLASLRLMGQALGRTRFEATLHLALPTQPRHMISGIVTEVFSASTPTASGRRGSLKDRMLQPHPNRPSSGVLSQTQN